MAIRMANSLLAYRQCLCFVSKLVLIFVDKMYIVC